MLTPENLLASMIFGAFGLGAFIYGKKNALLKPMLLGLALMVYPYFVENTLMLYGVGIALTVGLFL